MITEQEVKQYIEKEIVKYKVKYKLVARLPPGHRGATTSIKEQTIYFSTYDLAFLCTYDITLNPDIDYREIIDKIIRHESKHIEVSKKLIELNVPISRQKFIEYAIPSEMYVMKTVPTPKYDIDYLRDVILIELSTEQGQLTNNRRVQREPMYALLVTLFLTEHEIKAFFDPKAVKFLLYLKSQYNEINTIQDIKKVAERQIKHHKEIGW